MTVSSESAKLMFVRLIYGFLKTASDVYWYVDEMLTEHYAITVE